MLRINALLLGIAATMMTAGCRGPMPTFDPYAGYGSPRVPPPATGSYGKADAYYPGSLAPSGTAPTNGTSSNQTSSPRSTAEATWQPAGDRQDQAAANAAIGTGVRDQAIPTAYQTPATGASATNSAAGAGNPREADSTSLQARIQNGRLPITDATTVAPPGRFQPPPNAREISELPDAGSASSPTAAAETPPSLQPIPQSPHSASVLAPSNAAVAGQAAVTSSPESQPQWRAQYQPSRVDGIASR